jgi:hypothetical protein
MLMLSNQKKGAKIAKNNPVKHRSGLSDLNENAKQCLSRVFVIDSCASCAFSRLKKQNPTRKQIETIVPN